MWLRGPCRQGAHSTAWQGRQTSDSASATQRAQCQDGANKGDPGSTKEGRPTVMGWGSEVLLEDGPRRTQRS